jgi:hypothetical protein
MNTPPTPIAPEPKRWAVLRHDYPFLHWDLLLERTDAQAAATWRLLRRPCCDEPIAAESLPDHRVAYFDYEGPVSSGRGTVQRLERGEWHPLWIAPGFAATGPHANAIPPSQSADLLSHHGPPPLLKVQFSGSRQFSSGTLFSDSSGRLFWIFSATAPNTHIELNPPLVRIRNSC